MILLLIMVLIEMTVSKQFLIETVEKESAVPQSYGLKTEGAPTVGEKAAAALAEYAKEKNGNGTGNDYAADDLVSLITNPETIGGAVDAIKDIVGSEQAPKLLEFAKDALDALLKPEDDAGDDANKAGPSDDASEDANAAGTADDAGDDANTAGAADDADDDANTAGATDDATNSGTGGKGENGDDYAIDDVLDLIQQPGVLDSAIEAIGGVFSDDSNQREDAIPVLSDLAAQALGELTKPGSEGGGGGGGGSKKGKKGKKVRAAPEEDARRRRRRL
ncbi:uncharacterized protein LOC111696124 isoform X2 [Eurytemora carolleeae]|uniref:uncharacterized protein LOC111696124 isoform X2 n=1 Tax=Eurytemora carolleeae TaxID=1294199 RepID=UPI000C7760C6|nr:uncharacterized protein LOC111696124 isoform X2 [Eurytemora carolleeae]|eukprot:XP_023321442.1 uncharacterized protein LOC111696124 isoform X2 [Eurytemora affinis]